MISGSTKDASWGCEAFEFLGLDDDAYGVHVDERKCGVCMHVDVFGSLCNLVGFGRGDNAAGTEYEAWRFLSLREAVSSCICLAIPFEKGMTIEISE